MTRAAQAVASAALAAALVACSGCSADVEASEWRPQLHVDDVPMTPQLYAFNATEDLQLPELPTGCEACAGATLMRMHGVLVGKCELADELPRTVDGSDFVNCFWGEPRSVHGWACMAPCLAATMNRHLEFSGWAAFAARGWALDDLEAPFVAWVTIGLAEAQPSAYAQDGYTLLYNPHALVVRKVGSDYVSCIDPLEGEVVYPRGQFQKAYEANGCQAVRMIEWS